MNVILDSFKYLLSIIGIYFLEQVRARKFDRKLWIIILVCGIVFISHQLYKFHLKSTYGSIFLTSLNPAESFSGYINNIQVAIVTWWKHYFTSFDYLLISGVFIYGVILFFKQRSSRVSFLSKVSLIWISGNIIFSLAMSNQLTAHNYYFIDTFFLPLLLLFIQALKHNIFFTFFTAFL